MGIKLKKYSHSIITKSLFFIIAIITFTGFIKVLFEAETEKNVDFHPVFEGSFLESNAYERESEGLVYDLIRLLGEFKNEEHIINGGTIGEGVWINIEETLFEDYQFRSRSYNLEWSEGKKYEMFKQEYAEQIAKAKEKLINHDLREFHVLLKKLEEKEAPLYYASDGTNVFTNTAMTEIDQFKNNPSYLLFENYNLEIFPEKSNDQRLFYWINDQPTGLDQQNTVIYVAFTEQYLNQKTQEWQENKELATKYLYKILAYLAGFLLSFLYLIFVIGRKNFKDQSLHMGVIEKIYNDINILLCVTLISIWFVSVDEWFENIMQLILLFTVPIAVAVLLLLLSLVKHFKNKTFFKHTLIYFLIYHCVQFVRNVYNSGSVGVKTVLIVIGYPLLVALTFFIFPVTIGVAAWFAYKKVKSFQTIQKGVEIIKDGNLQHRIELEGKGEFVRLATNINSIKDGLKTAVASELKSERLKTELITNVSHDIRTPLTSIITYVDLLKFEKDPLKISEYVEVLDQKSKRLKILTDDLFEAAKASSGNIPVVFDKIDIVSLITQGLGEVNDKIETLGLNFKLNYPADKIYISADGKLLWRSIENVLSNIFKYSLERSRVYIDIEDLENNILLTFKNISAHELNISADELMERFTRGDESRTSEGSGLGLSIAKNLIEIQKGNFNIQIDGDLFKVMIQLPKFRDE